MSGAFTATEAGGIAVVYAMVLGFFAFRNLTIKGAWESLMITGRLTASLFLVVSLVSIASYVLILGGVSQWTAEILQAFSDSPILFMLVVAAALLILGSFLDPGPQVLLFIPVLMPIVRDMGIDELQFSMVFLLVGTLGLITPPVGVVLFVACRIGDIPVGRLFWAVIPFLIAQTLRRHPADPLSRSVERAAEPALHAITKWQMSAAVSKSILVILEPYAEWPQD